MQAHGGDGGGGGGDDDAGLEKLLCGGCRGELV